MHAILWRFYPSSRLSTLNKPKGECNATGQQGVVHIFKSSEGFNGPSHLHSFPEESSELRQPAPEFGAVKPNVAVKGKSDTTYHVKVFNKGNSFHLRFS